MRINPLNIWQHFAPGDIIELNNGSLARIERIELLNGIFNLEVFTKKDSYSDTYIKCPVTVGDLGKVIDTSAIKRKLTKKEAESVRLLYEDSK